MAAEMKRNKYGDFVVTKIEIKDDVVEVVEDLEIILTRYKF